MKMNYIDLQKIAKEIVDKLSDKKLTTNEGIYVLDVAKEIVYESSVIKTRE